MGAIFHNGKPYGGGGILNLVTKSWSDYNALSLAERNDSTKWYFVPDAPASGVPNIVKSVRDNITDAYDPESTYNKDDWCIYDNKLYICTTNNTTGEWDSTKWTRNNLEEIISTKADKKVLLWSNPSPTADFAQQTLTLPSLSEYNALELYYNGGKSEIILRSNPMAYGYMYIIGTSSSTWHMWNRYFYMTSDTSVIVSNCTKVKVVDGTASTDNSTCKPIRLYGIKF